jgi:integrase
MDWWAIDETTSRKHSFADPVNGKTVHCSKAFVWALNSCFRLMVLLDSTTGLRRSELLALTWRDEDFSRLELSVVRSIYLREKRGRDDL